MTVRNVAPGVQSVGAIDWDRRLFEDLTPLPEGTSYNAFLVRGSEKVALIDAVDTSMEMALMTNLFRAEADRIDYIVVNHAEQDHSGLVPLLLEMYAGATVVTNKICKDLLIAVPRDPRGADPGHRRPGDALARRPDPRVPDHALGPLAGHDADLPPGGAGPLLVRPLRSPHRDQRPLRPGPGRVVPLRPSATTPRS